jgi:conjugal transfer pilus assembly protein TraW
MVRVLLALLLYFPFVSNSKDFGSFGNSFKIIEQDILKVIKEKLEHLDSTGKLNEYNKIILDRNNKNLERPKPISLDYAKYYRVFFYDPSFMVREDIIDNNGNLIAKSGTKINPLEKVSLSKPLLFVDGDDAGHLDYIRSLKEIYTEITIILTKGNPSTLSKELNEEVYFDQGGFITTKLKIQKIPSLVTQEDSNRLRIEEIKIEEKACEGGK